MDAAASEETKPFEGDTPQTDDWNQPDPDEELMLNQGSGRAWLVKVPNYASSYRLNSTELPFLVFYRFPNSLWIVGQL